jgi:hypothetical protein
MKAFERARLQPRRKGSSINTALAAEGIFPSPDNFFSSLKAPANRRGYLL